jgi:hypothetical protein
MPRMLMIRSIDVMGQMVGPAVQLRIAYLLSFVEYREGIGVLLCLQFKEVMHAVTVLVIRIKTVPLYQDLSSFRLREERKQR